MGKWWKSKGGDTLLDDSVRVADLDHFVSSEQTGTGGAQNVAHGLGSAPGLVLAVPSDLTGGVYVVSYGTHTATNCVLTVTSGEKFKVFALL